jgi:polyhydroxybutyrate depolymerase
MAHRLACDISERIAAVVSISGATWLDASKCKPTSPVSIVEMHGDADDTVPYGGSASKPGALPGIPSAHDTVAHWAKYNGCTGSIQVAGAPLDLESSVPGAETKVEKYAGCVRGDVELWTAVDGPHAPLFTASFVPALFDYFIAHPKP